jgi:hypothetical protein
MAPPDDDTLDDDGALAGATAGDDELDRPVDPMPDAMSADPGPGSDDTP